jgi:hypothetical protein
MSDKPSVGKAVEGLRGGRGGGIDDSAYSRWAVSREIWQTVLRGKLRKFDSKVWTEGLTVRWGHVTLPTRG